MNHAIRGKLVFTRKGKYYVLRNKNSVSNNRWLKKNALKKLIRQIIVSQNFLSHNNFFKKAFKITTKQTLFTLEFFL